MIPIASVLSVPFDRARRAAAVALFALAAGACGHPAEPAAAAATLSAERGWIRATPPNAPVAGGYVTLHNRGRVDDRLVAVTSPAARRVEMHEMRMDGGAMRMRALPDGIAVKAGASVTLAPGGLHLMFVGPTRVLKAGEQVEVTLTYAKAPPQTLSFAVQPLGAAAPVAAPADGDDPHAHH